MRSPSGSCSTTALSWAVAVGVRDLLDGSRAIARQKLAESGLAVLADRLIKARQTTVELAQLDDLVDGHLHDLGELLVSRLAPELRAQLALGLADLDLSLSNVDRDANRAPVVLKPALNRLANPQRAVGREFEAAAPVELLDGANQPQHAFLHEVLHRQAVTLVAARLRDDQPQVGVDHLLLRCEVAALDALGQLDLVRRGQQRMDTRALEEQVERLRRPAASLDFLARMHGLTPRLALVAAGRRRALTCVSVAIATVNISGFQRNLRSKLHGSMDLVL